MLELLVRCLRMLGEAVVHFGLQWHPPPPPPDPPADRSAGPLTGPPPGHPERLCADPLPPELERLRFDPR
ncbi:MULTISPECIES: DUF6059 family protein [Streptomyces]|uniref:DUF6059 family protein n=1 Tax=Streptomyces TaxID=1883 RepID=UPI0004BDE770|nr:MULTISPECIES: DUF6059 family protein [Streptomyces]KOG62354.1 hypothetical protein ADK77_28230 [Streptomyces antibioticus]KOV74731.1 hypothetical protein ADL02_36795 [Streptomyces sp. NRRL WC-3723]